MREGTQSVNFHPLIQFGIQFKLNIFKFVIFSIPFKKERLIHLFNR